MSGDFVVKRRIQLLVIDIVERMYERDNINILANNAYWLYDGEVQFIDPQYLNCEIDAIRFGDNGELLIYLVDD